MKEEFLCFIWQYGLYNQPLSTTSGRQLRVINPGTINMDEGPDFFAARIEMDGAILVGNIEIHIKSSNWYHHRHQTSEVYDNILLHVVYEHDRQVYDRANRPVPVVELKEKFDRGLLDRYNNIIASKSWIACEKLIGMTNPVIITGWLNRLLAERLERRAGEIRKFFLYFNNHWEQTFYYFLSRNFGFKVNSIPFSLLAQQTPYKLLARLRNDPLRLEALLFGQAGMLNGNFADAFPIILLKEYQFLQHKYKLSPVENSLWRYYKLRPSNFPTIRISQFAQLIVNSTALFSKLIESNDPNNLKKLLTVGCSAYWNDHYLFDKISYSKPKVLGPDAISNILINTIVPLKFVYGIDTLKPGIREDALSLLQTLPAEQNSVIQKWKNIGIKPSNAGESQALLELKINYCTPRKCLNCPVGHFYIRNKQT